MSSLTVQIKGLEKTIKYFSTLESKKLPAAIREGQKFAASYVFTVMQNNAPVDTGRLRSSIKKTAGATDVLVGPDPSIAPYAVWVEHGHHTRSGSWVPGQFFVKRTATETAAGVQEIFSKVLKLALQ